MKIMLPLFALALSAAPAFAQADPNELWPVKTGDGSCTISQAFSDSDFGLRKLEISYDASRQQVSLSTTNTATGELSDSGNLWWRIMFLDNGREKQDEAWGARQFSYAREGDAYRFTARFAGEKNVRQILADLAASRGVGFLERREVVTAYDLGGARGAIERLRACAARTVAAS